MIGLHIGRQLKQYRLGFLPKQGETLLKELQAAGGCVQQAFPVRDEEGSFPGEDKILSGMIAPGFHGLRRGGSIEHAVEFGRFEL